MSLPTSEEAREERAWKKQGKPRCASCSDATVVNEQGLCHRCAMNAQADADDLHTEKEAA